MRTPQCLQRHALAGRISVILAQTKDSSAAEKRHCTTGHASRQHADAAGQACHDQIGPQLPGQRHQRFDEQPLFGTVVRLHAQLLQLQPVVAHEQRQRAHVANRNALFDAQAQALSCKQQRDIGCP